MDTPSHFTPRPQLPTEVVANTFADKKEDHDPSSSHHQLQLELQHEQDRNNLLSQKVEDLKKRNLALLRTIDQDDQEYKDSLMLQENLQQRNRDLQQCIERQQQQNDALQTQLTETQVQLNEERQHTQVLKNLILQYLPSQWPPQTSTAIGIKQTTSINSHQKETQHIIKEQAHLNQRQRTGSAKTLQNTTYRNYPKFPFGTNETTIITSIAAKDNELKQIQDTVNQKHTEISQLKQKISRLEEDLRIAAKNLAKEKSENEGYLKQISQMKQSEQKIINQLYNLSLQEQEKLDRGNKKQQTPASNKRLNIQSTKVILQSLAVINENWHNISEKLLLTFQQSLDADAQTQESIAAEERWRDWKSWQHMESLLVKTLLITPFPLNQEKQEQLTKAQKLLMLRWFLLEWIQTHDQSL